MFTQQYNTVQYATHSGPVRFNIVNIFTKIALAITVTLCLGTSSAWADTFHLLYVDFGEGDGDRVEVSAVKDDNGNVIHILWSQFEDGLLVAAGEFDPNPEGDGSTSTVDKEAIIEAIKKAGDGGNPYTPNIWGTEFGKYVLGNGNGTKPGHPGEPIDPPHLVGGMDGVDHGGGGLHLNAGSIQEQINANKGKGRKDDDDDDDGYNPPAHEGEQFPGPPELVNPIPVEIEFTEDELADVALQMPPTTMELPDLDSDAVPVNGAVAVTPDLRDIGARTSNALEPPDPIMPGTGVNRPSGTPQTRTEFTAAETPSLRTANSDNQRTTPATAPRSTRTHSTAPRTVTTYTARQPKLN